jgi:hypothetical protein
LRLILGYSDQPNRVGRDVICEIKMPPVHRDVVDQMSIQSGSIIGTSDHDG